MASNTSNSDFDLVVIGSGPGGYMAAIRAAQLGMRVACVEKDQAPGGTCLNIGCIPSKALLDSSERFHMVQDGLVAHGIKVSGVELDLPAMLSRKDRVVKGLTTGVSGLLKKNKVERFVGLGRLTSATTVSISGAETRTLTTKKILIATGSVPIGLPALPFDGKRIVCSTEALSFSTVPKTMLVVGAGAIGLELGSVWARLGTAVHVVEFLDRIVPGMDRKMGDALQKLLQKQGLTFQLQTTAKSATVSSTGVRITLESNGKSEERDAEVVLVAVGRRAYTEGLGLREIGIEVDPKGRIAVDAQFQTNIRGVYAIGDVIAGPMLAHKAEEEGVAAVEIMAGQAGHVNYEAIPAVVYTAPELAAVGISEEQAKERGIEVRIGTFPFLANGRAKAMGETDGMVKMIADAKTDRVLGIHILGARASDMIAEAVIAMEFFASAEDIARSSHAHPTMPEAIKEAALAVHGRTLNI